MLKSFLSLVLILLFSASAFAIEEVILDTDDDISLFNVQKNDKILPHTTQKELTFAEKIKNIA